MIVKFFDYSNFYKKSSFYKRGDYMTMKNIFKKGKDDGHLE